MVTPSKLTPVSRFVAAFGMLPSSYKEAMTYEEQIVWLCNFLEKEVIPAINNNADGLTELQNLFVELKNYVDNYFDNLDIQAEVDAKIDEMVESGEMQEIVTAYLAVKGVLGFNTVADMKAGTNFIDGSIARTLGKTTYNDKEGSFYYIRDLKNTDVIDEINIIAITNYPDLVAEKIKDKSIEDLQSDVTTINGQITTINGDIDNLEAQLAANKVVLVGDSYATYYQSELQQLLGVSNADWYNYSVGGAGFVSNGSNTYYNNLTASDSAITDKTKVKGVIIAGGWNDRGHVADDSIETAMQTLFTYIKTNYPNAKIYCGMLANTKEIDDTVGSIYSRNSIQNNLIPKYKKCIDYGVQYLTGVEQVMHNYTYFDSDNVHPNSDGGTALAKAISQAVKSGYYAEDGKTKYININNTTTGLTLNETNVTTSTNFGVTVRIKNGNCHMTVAGDIYINNKNTSNQQLTLDIATYTNEYTATRYVNQSQIAFMGLAYNNTNYYPVYGYISFRREGTVRLTINTPQNITGIRRILFNQLTKTVIPIDFM